MDIRSRKTRQIESHAQSEKKELAIRAAIKRGKPRLDASQNALRVVEQAIGGKLAESKQRPSR